MNPKLQLLQDVLGKFFHSGKEYLFYCPKCKHHKQKLSINIEKNVFKCWVCEYKSNSISNIVKQYGNSQHIFEWGRLSGEINLSEKEDLKKLIIEIDKNDIENESIISSLPKEFISLVGNFGALAQRPRKYLFNRGLEEEDIIKWKIGFAIEGEYQNRIIFPSFNNEGKINYFVTRTFDNDFIKYKNPVNNKNIIFNYLSLNFRKPLTIVEGIFDAIKAKENVVPILGSSLSLESKLFFEIVKNNTICYIGLDPDVFLKELKIIESLLLYGIKIFKIQVKPFKDIGEMSKEEFQKRKNESIEINQEKFLLYKMLNV